MDTAPRIKPPQLLLTLHGARLRIEATDETCATVDLDARDTEAALATVGRWVMRVREVV